MAKATLTKGQQKTKKQYTIICGESELSLIAAALFRAQASDSGAVRDAACALHVKLRDPAHAPSFIYSSNKSRGFADTYFHETMGCPHATPDNLQVTSVDVPDGEPEPGKVVLEMSEYEAEAVGAVMGCVSYSGPTHPVFMTLKYAGVDGDKFKVSGSPETALVLRPR